MVLAEYKTSRGGGALYGRTFSHKDRPAWWMGTSSDSSYPVRQEGILTMKAKSLDINGEEYKVKHEDLGENNGHWTSEKTIEIHKDISHTEELYLRTLMHEGLHGVIHESGLSEDISLPQEHQFINPTVNFLFKNFDIKLKRKKK
jgi:hypothetical protein